jgi:S1-C subfamily serine protease
MLVRPQLSAAIIVAALIGLTLGVRVTHAQELQEADVTKLSPAVVAEPGEDRGDTIVWEDTVVAPERTLYMRLHFTDIRKADTTAYRVVIRAADERVLASYNGDDFNGAESFFTELLYASAVKVQVQTRKRGTSPKALRFAIDSFVSAIDVRGRLTPQSILPAWRSLDSVPGRIPARQLADAIAKLYMGDGAVCSGFLVGPELLLTNHHCLAHSTQFRQSPTQCGDILIHFDFNNQARPDQYVALDCVEVLTTDAGVLDYALLRTSRERDRLTPRTILKFSMQTGIVSDLFMIHHPAGLATQVSFDCAIKKAGKDEVQHDCSTTNGSSGAPVLRRDGTVVALHNDGAYPEDLTIAALTARLAKGEVFLNKARPATAVREAIKKYLP